LRRVRALRAVWAAEGSLQRFGSATFFSISASSRARASRSKMPPELRETPLEGAHLADEVVDLEAAGRLRHSMIRALGRSGTAGARSQKRRAERGDLKSGEYS